MGDGEVYAVKDLMSRLCRSEADVRRIVDFLVKYGVLSYVSQREGLFRRVSGIPPPEVTIELLRSIIRE